ncbi:uncharacterized protein LOC143854841 [Tasmannia lanceolata]|uniref:uncharacterized protein LOC143854841 n=1 Tax=Tasmannia lanceolata TaxID=3420 RepID=UPI00406318A5
MEDNTTNKRVRDDSDESPETKRLRANLLDILDDFDSAGDRNLANQDLASVMKSFEEEIQSQDDKNEILTQATQISSDSGESLPDLGYLLEASDDELGLPPTFSVAGENDKENEDDIFCVSDESAGLEKMWRFDDEIPSYDELGFGSLDYEKNNEEASVIFEGLFGPSDFSEFSWLHESLPAR